MIVMIVMMVMINDLMCDFDVVMGANNPQYH